MDGQYSPALLLKHVIIEIRKICSNTKLNKKYAATQNWSWWQDKDKDKDKNGSRWVGWWVQSAKKISKKEATIQFSQTYFLLNLFFFSIHLFHLCFPANIIFLYSPLLISCKYYKCEVFKLGFIILLCVKPCLNYFDDPVVVEYYQRHFYVDLPFLRPTWNTKIL